MSDYNEGWRTKGALASDTASFGSPSWNKNQSEEKSIRPRKRPRIWAIGGGKGGVGKSLISASFSYLLARKGKRVVSVDLDLGGANLHTCMGMPPPKWGLGDWFLERKSSLVELLIPSPQPGLLLISGATDPASIADVVSKKKSDFLKELEKMDVDEVILDLGAGTHPLTVDFFVSADEGIVSILPEPTSVENAYRFLRNAFYQQILNSDVSNGLREVIVSASQVNNDLGVKVPADLLKIVDRLDEEAGVKLREKMRLLNPSIVINQVRSPLDIDVGKAVCSVCRRYFGVGARYAGYIDFDNTVWKAVRSKKAAVVEFPRSMLCSRMAKLTDSLLGETKGVYP